MAGSIHLAFDLGATSGRAILGHFNQGKITITEIHRFPNPLITVHGHLRWDTNHLFREIKNALRSCVLKHQIIPDSMAVDTWGVDFCLLGTVGELLEQPFAYRDILTQNAMEEVFDKMEPSKLYAETGIQFMPFNSLFQLWAIKHQYPVLMARTSRMIFMPDYLTHQLSGETYSEYTIASTSQMIDPIRRKWNPTILMNLQLPIDFLQDIVDPGTQVGALKNEISSALGIPQIPIIAVGAHDTASAIAAIPALGTNWAYISSGTWSLMGIEVEKPVITEKSFEYSFTNEGGVGGTTRLLKNITGLWLLEECKRIWDQESPLRYSDLIELSKNEKSFRSLIDPDHPSFHKPDNMIIAIQEFCKSTGQEVPDSPGQLTLCIMESLALKYRVTLEQLKEISNKNIETLHIIGGGSQNDTLSQFAANATALPVISGPAEGTALGNLLVQALASGQLNSLEEIRCVVKNSVETKQFSPSDGAKWERAFTTFLNIIDNAHQ